MLRNFSNLARKKKNKITNLFYLADQSVTNHYTVIGRPGLDSRWPHQYLNTFCTVSFGGELLNSQLVAQKYAYCQRGEGLILIEVEGLWVLQGTIINISDKSPGYGLCHFKFTCVQCWFSPSLKYFVLKSLQVGVLTNPPDWFQLKSKELNPCDPKKWWIPPQERREEHTHTQPSLNKNIINFCISKNYFY